MAEYSLRSSKQCPQCNATFTFFLRSTKRFCSEPCRAANYRAKKRELREVPTVHEATCKNCGHAFAALRRAQQFCSKGCRCAMYNTVTHGRFDGCPVSPGTAGAIGELRAAADLMLLNLPVFRALSPSCPCDLVVLHGAELLTIEVRNGYRNLVNQAIVCSNNHQGADLFAVYLRAEDSVHYSSVTKRGEDFLRAREILLSSMRTKNKASLKPQDATVRPG